MPSRDVASDTQYPYQISFGILHRRFDGLQEHAAAIIDEGHPFFISA